MSQQYRSDNCVKENSQIEKKKNKYINNRNSRNNSSAGEKSQTINDTRLNELKLGLPKEQRHLKQVGQKAKHLHSVSGTAWAMRKDRTNSGIHW